MTLYNYNTNDLKCNNTSLYYYAHNQLIQANTFAWF